MSNPSEVHEHFKKGENVMDDKIEFNEYRNPEYWMKLRMRRAFLENVVPAIIVILTFVAYVVIGYIEGAI